MLDDVAPRGLQDQVALGVQGHAFSALNGELDGAGIGTRGHDEVVFELPLVAVIDQIDTWIDVLVLDLTEAGDAGVPMDGIVTDQIVTRAGLPVETNHGRLGIGAEELHAQYGFLGRCLNAGRRLISQTQHCLAGRQEQAEAGATGRKLTWGLVWPWFASKVKGQLAIGLANLGFRGAVGAPRARVNGRAESSADLPGVRGQG